MMRPTLISVVVPVYNEGENIQPCLRGLWRALEPIPHEILVCFDTDTDTTLPAIENMVDRPPTTRLVKNTLGPGVAFALRSGFQAARGDVIITTMADLSDPPEIIPWMAEKIRKQGADVVSGSRYMRGGSQNGGPRLKGFLSRAAGLSLCWLAGLRTHDATNNFRAYSRRLIDRIQVESCHGFEVGLEITVKAHLLGMNVSEVPSEWNDRAAGQSRFRLWTWLPRYMHWYWMAMEAPVLVTLLILALAIVGGIFAGRIVEEGVLVGGSLCLVWLARCLRGRTVKLDAALPVLVYLVVRFFRA